MSEQTFRVQFDGFYYHSPRQEGLQVTAMTAQLPAALRTQLNNFMCNVHFSGDKKEERLVYCPPLHGFCKLFISRDAQYARDYFYHGITIGERGFLSTFTAAEDPFVNRISALLHGKSTANGTNVPPQLPTETGIFPLISADSLSAGLKTAPAQAAKLVFLAFKPILSLGQQLSTFRFPAPVTDACTSEKSIAAATFVLSVLPKELHDKVNMRFSADRDNLSSAFNCNYLFLCGDVAADFDSEKQLPLLPGEDPMGIFTAMGNFICTYGLAAYRMKILPVLSCWAAACLQKGRFSPDLLYVLLSGIAELKLPQRKINADILAQFFSTADAQWYEVCAPVLIKNIRSLPASEIRKAMQENALFNRTDGQLPTDGMDSFFLLFAGLCAAEPYAEKEKIMTALYDRFAKTEHTLLLAEKIKAGMFLTLQLPAKPTPENIFSHVRSLERKNPTYVSLAANAAVDGFVAQKDETWINCLHSLLSDPLCGEEVRKVLYTRCEDLLNAAETRKTLAWVSVLCAARIQADPIFKTRFLHILSGKKINYEEFLFCLCRAGLSEQDIPAQPAAKGLAKSVDSLEALAKVNVPKKEEEALPVQAGILNRLCELLEQDCTWQDFRKYIPVILKTAAFRPTMSIQPKIETLLLRQLTVLATDILVLIGGQEAYVDLLVSLRRDFCLCLYPTTGAAAGKFDKKKKRASAVKKVLSHILPCLVQAVVLMISIYFLFVFLRVFPAASVLHTALPGAACAVGAVLIVLQTAVLRRYATKDYILPAGIILLAAGLLQLLV